MPGLKTQLTVAIFVAAVAFQAASFSQPLRDDDIYVVENLASNDWGRRLFAFDVDNPSADHGAWWAGAVTQRRFLRLPSSAALWAEWVIFGRNPVGYHIVTASLIALSAILIFRCSLRTTSFRLATLMALFVAAHPASAEIAGGYGALNRQPLAMAGLFSVAAAGAWDHMRRTCSRLSFVLALIFAALATTAYEAALVLPLLLMAADPVFWRPFPRGHWLIRQLALAVIFGAHLGTTVAPTSRFSDA